MNSESFDVIIIGGGVAGISAALWCDELGLNSTLLESNNELGGQLLWTHNAIENHLGIKAENGTELRDVFVHQIKERKFELKLNSKVAKVDLAKKSVLLKDGQKISAKAIVIATGVRRRTLGIKGEKRFQGKGIIKSGKANKDLVMGRKVLIVGGGDAALENAQILSDTASEIYVANRSKEFRAREEFLDSAKHDEKITLLTETVLMEIRGDEKIENVRLEHNNKAYTLEIDAVLFRIGVLPNTEFLTNKIELDEQGYIKISSTCKTNLDGIYAIGDVANPISPTVSSANGMGTTAIKAIHSHVKKLTSTK